MKAFHYHKVFEKKPKKNDPKGYSDWKVIVSKNGFLAEVQINTKNLLYAKDLPFFRAVWYARLGENDAAFRELERAYATRSIWMPYINESVWFRKAFRADPRFEALRERMHLPESRSRDP